MLKLRHFPRSSRAAGGPANRDFSDSEQGQVGNRTANALGAPTASRPACRAASAPPKNLCVWSKTNADMGAFYRSQHELVFVFKVATASHINNFGLGGRGRYRSNVWVYPGVNTFKRGRMAELEAHPTVKPLAMVVDARKDCSRRSGVVLDPFLGSGTTSRSGFCRPAPCVPQVTPSMRIASATLTKPAMLAPKT